MLFTHGAADIYITDGVKRDIPWYVQIYLEYTRVIR